MKKFLFIAILFFVFPAISFAQVIINEIAWMGTTESANAEWVELYNTTSENIDLSGWGLYEAGGGTSIISLSKNISANGYFLIERTTPSVADPVTGINDVSGSFGGSGFSNNGEFLVLKDSTGNTIQSLDFSGGWPAGDNTTKETMQWTGSNWITASPTPGVANATSGSDSNSSDFSGEVLGASSGSSSSSAASSGGGTTDKVSSLNAQLEIIAGNDRTTSPGSPIWFQATVKKNTTGASPELNWSFGDGNVGVGPLVSHTYKYSGDYVVVLSANAGDIFSVSRLKVRVTESDISISDKSEYLEISNNGNTEVNLFNWKIENEGKGFVFQPNTIILPKSSIKLDKSLLKMKGYDNSLGTSLKNSLKEEVFVVDPVKKVREVDLTEAAKNLENIKKEAFAIQAKIPNIKTETKEIEKNTESTEKTETTTNAENIIYEAPPKTSLLTRAWNFLVGMLH